MAAAVPPETAVRRVHMAHHLFRGNPNFLEDNSFGILVIGARRNGDLVLSLAEEYIACKITVFVNDIDAAACLRVRFADMQGVTIYYIPVYCTDTMKFTRPWEKYGLAVLDHSLHEVADEAAHLDGVRRLLATTRCGVLIKARAAPANAATLDLMKYLAAVGATTTIAATRAALRRLPINHFANAAARNGCWGPGPVADLLSLTDADLRDVLRCNPVTRTFAFSCDSIMATLESGGFTFAGWATDRKNTGLLSIKNDVEADWTAIPDLARVFAAHVHYGNISDFFMYATQARHPGCLRPGPRLRAWPVIITAALEQDMWASLYYVPDPTNVVIQPTEDHTAVQLCLHGDDALHMRDLFELCVQRPRKRWDKIRNCLPRCSAERVDALARLLVAHNFLRFTVANVDTVHAPANEREVVEVAPPSARPRTPLDRGVQTIEDAPCLSNDEDG